MLIVFLGNLFALFFSCRSLARRSPLDGRVAGNYKISKIPHFIGGNPSFNPVLLQLIYNPFEQDRSREKGVKKRFFFFGWCRTAGDFCSRILEYPLERSKSV